MSYGGITRRGADRRSGDRRAGMATEVRVGESVSFRAPMGTGEVVLTLTSKDVERFLGPGDNATVHLSVAIERRDGQRVRMRLIAPDSVVVVPPARAVEPQVKNFAVAAG